MANFSIRNVIGWPVTLFGTGKQLRERLKVPAVNLEQALYVSEPLKQTQRVMLKDENVCVHCGLCTASCPTYVELGNENDSPRGRIYLMRAVTDGRLELGPEVRRHLELCLDCRALA